jgi:hypothetical protein
MASCNPAANETAGPKPEAEQTIGARLKDLYMAASKAPSQSAAQRKVILRMAQKASNGKELLLVARAAIGAFPAAAGPEESQLRSILTAKMIALGTLDQLIEYATRYPIDEQSARPFVERMFQLGNGDPNPREWYRIRVVALQLKVGDLERQAQGRGDQLAGR